MIFLRKKKDGNRITFYILGKKILSYKKNTKYNKIYAKRFNGLTRKEERYILETQFKKRVGYKLNLDNPQTFNEKIQWLKFNYRDPLMTKCADKIGVREYVKEKIGEQYLVPIIGIYNSVDEINFENLPEKFVAKVNWGSGQNIIVTNKLELDIETTKRKLAEWMKPENNLYYEGLEWVYKNINPKIIIEEYIQEADDLIDYKFFCYNSEPKNMFIVKNRKLGKDNMTLNFFDSNFNSLPFTRNFKRSEEIFTKPILWDEMIKISKILAEPFPFVRVDFYMLNNQLKIGELTFYPGNGVEPFDPVEWDYKFGELLQLPNFKNH